jgi:DUF971 family protein
MGAAATEIEWDDGKKARYPHRVLRGLCPCAHCQGHQGPLRWVAAVENASKLMLEISKLEPVGNYAIGIEWADGHSGGIYSFTYLQDLARLENAEVEQLRAYRVAR